MLEGETLPYELLGESKVKESFSRIVASANILRKNFGRIFVEFCQPISLSEYENKEIDVESKVDQIKTKIINELNQNSIVMPTNILASILLMHRKGVSEEILIARSDWLAQELLKRNKRIGSLSDTSAHIPVRNGIKLLENIVRKRKDMFNLSITPKVDYKNLLLLGYYRNALLNTFASEAIMISALASFGHQIAWKEGVDKKRLLEENYFLINLFENEFLLNKNEEETFQKLVKYQVVSEANGRVKVADDLMIGFLCSLIWPFVESYWVTVVYLFSLKSKNENDGILKNKLVHQVSYSF